MTERLVLTAAAQAVVLIGLLAGNAAAQNYPNRPIRLVLPVAPGGTSDAMARILGPRLNDALGQPLVVDNRPGAGGNIAADIVAKSAPDGYTIFMGQPMLTTNQSLYSKLSYDPIRDFAAITHLGTGLYILVAHPSVPAKNVAELVALAKAKPGTLNFGSSGVGSASHLAGELLKTRAGIEMTHVPYKGGGPAALAVLAGEIPLSFGTVTSALPHVKAGRLKAIAATGLQRSPFAPEVPTLDESGFPGFNVTTWDCFVAPAGTPTPIVMRIHDETVKVLRMPEIRELVNKIGYEPTGTTPAELAAFLRSESALWAKVIKTANIRAE